MANFRGNESAFGAPGAEPTWAHSAKDGVGTSYSTGGRIWFTLWRGILTEVFYPTVDRPQIRDLEFLFSDGKELLLAERDLAYQIERILPSQGYLVRKRDAQQRFSFTKEVIVDPKAPCVLLRAKIEGDDAFLQDLKTYVLCAPHLEVGGENNNAFVVEASGRQLLVAEKNNRWLVLGASVPFSRLSCGYVGRSDGYTDLRQHREMRFEFDEAKDGNVALTGQLDLSQAREFTLGLACGETLSSAISALFQSLGIDYQRQRKLFLAGWDKAASERLPLESASGDGGRLFHSSYNLLLALEDKLYRGAFIASPTIPFGEARNDKTGKGGYHLVWARDMVQTSLGLLAAGNKEAPMRALLYLAARQEEDGSFPQNFWVNGDAYAKNLQLDEVAFPVLLTWRLHLLGLLTHFNPRVMVRRAVSFLLHSGPITGQERWEESGGYSPSTLALIAAAFLCAAALEHERGELDTAAFLESYANFLRSHLEEWTVTTQGALVSGAYFVRLNPAKPGEVPAPGAVNTAQLHIPNQPPGSPDYYPARDVTDAGFLSLVRYGVLPPDHPLIINSLRAVDATLKVDTPAGPCWRRYNHDGYGQRPDGGPFLDWGTGRPWPLLTGERGRYEMSMGRDCRPFLAAMEQFSGETGLLAEQVWDQAAIPEAHLRCGGPTGSAVPLLWAHSEYLRLLRSRYEGQVFEYVPEVTHKDQKTDSRIEFWLPNYPARHVKKNCTVRICRPEPFRLRWSADNWKTSTDYESRKTAVGWEYVDLALGAFDSRIDFTFQNTKPESKRQNHVIEAT